MFGVVVDDYGELMGGMLVGVVFGDIGYYVIGFGKFFWFVC